MPTPNLNVILQGIIAVQNNLAPNSPQITTLDLQNPTFGGTAVFFDPYFQATIGLAPVTLPASRVFGIVVQNLSTTNPLQVIYTPYLLPQVSTTFGPGGVFISFDPAETGTGYTSLILSGISVTVPAMVLVVV